MRPRLLKDLRLVLPFALGGVALAAFLPQFTFPIACLAALCIGVALFGIENGMRHLDWMLAQPLPRRRLWMEKAGVGVALLLLLALGLPLAGIALQAMNQQPSDLIRVSAYAPSGAELGTADYSAYPENEALRRFRTLDQERLRQAPEATIVTTLPLAFVRESIARGDGTGSAGRHITLGLAAADWIQKVTDKPLPATTDGLGHLIGVDFAPLGFHLLGVVLTGLGVGLGLMFGGLWMGMLLRNFISALSMALLVPLGVAMLASYAALLVNPLWTGAFVTLAFLLWSVIALFGSLRSLNRLEV